MARTRTLLDWLTLEPGAGQPRNEVHRSVVARDELRKPAPRWPYPGEAR